MGLELARNLFIITSGKNYKLCIEHGTLGVYIEGFNSCSLPEMLEVTDEDKIVRLGLMLKLKSAISIITSE